MSISPPPSPLSSDDALDVAVLSPKSKVKALLATVEDDSDTESAGKGSVSGALEEVLTSKLLSNQNAAEIHDGSAVSGGTDDSDRDVPVIAHGKLAQKLHEISNTSCKASPEEDGGESLTARERLRRRLIRQTQHLRDVGGRGQQIQSEDELALDSDFPKTEQEKHSMTLEQDDSRSFNSDGSPCGSPRNETPAPLSQSIRAVSDSDSNLPKVNNRFQELVAKKRAERQAREAVEEAKKTQRNNIISRSRLLAASDDDDSDADAHAGRRLTQQARPTRKASKKAIEEMNRETQRLNRNRQLAHEAKTKKKISKQSFFDRFKAAQQPSTEEPVPVHSSSTVPTSAPVSDHEEIAQRSSPPSSPASIGYVPKDAVINAKTCGVRDFEGLDFDKADGDLPNLDDVLAQKALLKDIESQKDSALIKSLADHEPSCPNMKPKKPNTTIRDRITRKQLTSHKRAEESDSELDIVPTQRSRARLDAFQGKTQMKRNDHSLQTLRALAHLNSPPDKKANRSSKSTMSLAELQASLRRQARQQAALERAEKIRELKEKGVVIQTNEERARNQAEVEDLLEKAQKEAADIREKEKRTAKKNGNADEDDNDALLDTSDDEDYKGSQEDADEEFSGSEEDECVQDDGEDESARTGAKGPGGSDGFVIGEASEDERDEAELEGEEANDEDEEAVNDHVTDEESDAADMEMIIPGPRRRARAKIIADDDDDDAGSPEPVDCTPSSISIRNPLMPTTSNPSKVNKGMLGLTQAFAATMADSQTQDEQLAEQQDSITLLGTLPEPDLTLYDADMVEDSQVLSESVQDHTNAVPEEIVLDFTQSQILRYDTQDQLQLTQDNELPDPSQDAGFVLSSPVGRRFVTPVPSTVETVLLSPAVQPRGRLRRGKLPVAGDDDDEESLSKKVSENVTTPNAFDAMKERTSRTKAQAAYDKKKSNAKEMVEEQAQESEDEYAGIGGASDDESGGDNDEEVQKMIDESEINVDEQQLAALHADKERALDSAAVAKLFKDLNSGALRRKRGAAGHGDLDFFSDSDDERTEARQRAKRKEFARMRKALLENENVGKIATDPKKMAFLKAIEDRDEEDDGEGLDFLVEATGNGGGDEDSQQQQGTQEVPDSQVGSINPTEVAGQAAAASAATGQKRKRPLQDSGPNVLNRPGPSKRRPKIAQKPATLAEIRESLSFLTETPESLETAAASSVDDAAASSGHSSEEENRNVDFDTENQAPDLDRNDGFDTDGNTMKPPPKVTELARNSANPRRRRPNPNASVIDRLSLRREQSSTSASTTTTTNAFPHPSLSTTATSSLTSKIPPLLLRATTSSLSMSMSLANNHNTGKSSTGVTTATHAITATTERTAGGGAGGVVPGLKRGGSKKSSILWQAREAERREVVGKVEERRRRERERVVERWKAKRRGKGKGMGVGVSMGRGEESWG